MRKLRIDLSDLELTFDNSGEMISYYLDTETGEIISITDDERRLLESIYESFYNEQTQMVDWAAAFQEERIPEWQRERLQDADRVEALFGISKMCCWIIPPSGSGGAGSSRIDYTNGRLTG